MSPFILKMKLYLTSFQSFFIVAAKYINIKGILEEIRAPLSTDTIVEMYVMIKVSKNSPNVL